MTKREASRATLERLAEAVSAIDSDRNAFLTWNCPPKLREPLTEALTAYRAETRPLRSRAEVDRDIADEVRRMVFPSCPPGTYLEINGVTVERLRTLRSEPTQDSGPSKAAAGQRLLDALGTAAFGKPGGDVVSFNVTGRDVGEIIHLVGDYANATDSGPSSEDAPPSASPAGADLSDPECSDPVCPTCQRALARTVTDDGKQGWTCTRCDLSDPEACGCEETDALRERLRNIHTECNLAPGHKLYAQAIEAIRELSKP